MTQYPDYAQYSYRQPDGTVDYERYVRTQSETNAGKLRYQWVKPRTIHTICDYLAGHVPIVRFGLCHGTRRGDEQAIFKQYYPECVVVGTEIAPTATQFPDTIQWDFHEIKPEWEGAADFVYSNSLDHAYDPQLAVGQWIRCLATPGYCFVEWWGEPVPTVTPADCFRATLAGCQSLLREWGKAADDSYGIVDTLTRIRSPRHGTSSGAGAVFVLAKE